MGPVVKEGTRISYLCHSHSHSHQFGTIELQQDDEVQVTNKQTATCNTFKKHMGVAFTQQIMITTEDLPGLLKHQAD